MSKLNIKSTIIGTTIVLLAALMSSCSPFDDPYLPIEGNINLRMYEQLDSTERQIYLILETERMYDCSNYELFSNTSVNDSVLNIELEHIFKPQVCYTSRGPAVASFNLTGLADSVYHFTINMDNFTRSGTITKTFDEYRLNMADGAPLLIANKTLKRVPEGVLWGIIEYDKPSSTAYIDTFFMMLDSIGASSNKYANGEYNFFEVADSAIVNPGSDSHKLSEVFLMDFNGSFSLVAYWAAYSAYYSQDVQIRVSSDKPYFYDTHNP